MSKKIFFTGGSGFVGQNVIPILIKAGHNVYALARSEQSARKVLKVGAIPVQDDLTQLTASTVDALKKCDLVIHAAAYMDFNYQEELFYQLNVEATRKLLQLAKENGIERFIYISAAAIVPGTPVENVSEATMPLGFPDELYPKTKAIAEKAVLEANSPDFLTLALRPPAIWGPNNPHFTEILERVKNKQWMWIGGGNHVLSTIHTTNLAVAIIAAIENGNGGQAYFVTDGDRRTVKTSFGSIIQAYGLDPGNRNISVSFAAALAHFFESVWKFFGLKSRPPIPPLLVRLMGREFSVNDAKAREELGYQPVVSFMEGLESLG